MRTNTYTTVYSRMCCEVEQNGREEDLGMYDCVKSKTRLLNGSAYCPEKYVNGFFTNSQEQDFASINFGYHSNTYLPDDRPTYLVCTRTIKTYNIYRKFLVELQSYLIIKRCFNNYVHHIYSAAL